ncbi:MAG: DUF6600 domain-containing protein [Acidithiobacillales bacterium]
MASVRIPIPAALVLAAALAAPAAAERASYSYVSYAGQEVSLLSSAADEEAARVNTPVLSGDRIVTGPSSRAEVVLASGNVIRIDAKSELRFDLMSFTYESDDDRDLLYLAGGDAVVEIRDSEAGERAFRLDTDDATVVVEGRGLVRVDAGRRGTEVYVLSGEAQVLGRAGSVTVREGGYALVTGEEQIETGEASQPGDQFARFVDERQSRPSAGEAAEWVSSDYDYESSLAAFDENGSWVYAPSYDRWCWRPSVAADWRPYSLGYWRWTPPGLTWVSYEPWGWLPYHFGTWCKEPTVGWVWLPGAAFAPAWVWWSYTPTWVGWCPIGYAGGRGNGSPWAFRAAGGLARLPRVGGRVDVTRIDANGWNYAPLNRIGKRLDPSRDIVRGERLPVPAGATAIVSTIPLRLERSGTPTPAAVREVLRREAEGAGPRSSLPVDEGLTALLRNDPTLTPTAEREVLRSTTPARRDQPAAPRVSDTAPGPRRLGGGFALPRTTLREEGRPRAPIGEADWRVVPSGRDVRSAVSAAPRRQPALDNGWRSPASRAPAEVQPRREGRSAPNDTGWRAPRRESRLTPSAPQAAPARAGPPVPRFAAPAPPPARNVAPPPAPPRAAPAPARHAAPAAPHAAPKAH